VDVPNAMDGVPGVTQKPVPPGETFVYEFDARLAGTRWYHTNFQGRRQMDLGLVAPLIIEPAGRDPFPFDREYTLVLDDWATRTGSALPPTREGTAGGRGGMGGMMSETRGTMGGMGGSMMGGREMGGMMRGGNAHDVPYDVMTINGKALPGHRTAPRAEGRARPAAVHQRERRPHARPAPRGDRLRVTHTDGNPLIEGVEVDALPIAPSERYDVLVVANRPGAWFLQCVQPGHAEAGERTAVLYEGSRGATPEQVPQGIAGLVVWNYALEQGRDVLRRAAGPARAFNQTLSDGMMESDRWTINGKQYPDTDPIAVKEGDLVRVRLANISMEAHPMHLHGHSFRMLAVNGQRLAAPLVKDTVARGGAQGRRGYRVHGRQPGRLVLSLPQAHAHGGRDDLARQSGGGSRGVQRWEVAR
jgi:multicopper oxidase